MILVTLLLAAVLSGGWRCILRVWNRSWGILRVTFFVLLKIQSLGGWGVILRQICIKRVEVPAVTRRCAGGIDERC